MSRCAEPVVYVRPHLVASAFVRLLEGVTSFVDREPLETFADEVVLAAGEELCRRFHERVREANDR